MRLCEAMGVEDGLHRTHRLKRHYPFLFYAKMCHACHANGGMGKVTKGVDSGYDDGDH